MGNNNKSDMMLTDLEWSNAIACVLVQANTMEMTSYTLEKDPNASDKDLEHYKLGAKFYRDLARKLQNIADSQKK